MSQPVHVARCRCDAVELAFAGSPMTASVCYCKDCQEAARRIGALPGAACMADENGGTQFVLFRADRMTKRKGAELLQAQKLNDKTATSRYVTSCCNSAMYLQVDRIGHWVSVYAGRFPDETFPPRMRINTKSAPDPGSVPNDVPGFAGFPLRFLAKLATARLAMLVGR